MKVNRYLLTSAEMLEAIFQESESAYVGFQGRYDKSVYGTLRNLKEMPEYELAFPPYISLAKSCGMASMSLKRSIDTGRFYLWNVNLGGHAPKLELRPVQLSHVLNLELMRSLHENWAYLLGCNIDTDPGFTI